METTRRENKVRITGVEKVTVEEYLRTYYDGGAMKEILIMQEEYHLKEVSIKEVISFRKQGVPSLVIKEGTQYFWVKVPKSFSMITFKSNHLCANCRRLRAVPYECGGCPKVCDRSIEEARRQYNDDHWAFEFSKRIEKYEFIIVGVEVFNTKNTMLIVEECLAFEKERQ